jgi:hypothetical protein
LLRYPVDALSSSSEETLVELKSIVDNYIIDITPLDDYRMIN